MKNQFIGTWKLIDCFTIHENTKEYPLGKNAIGTIVYTENNFVSVNLFNTECPNFLSDDVRNGTDDEKVKTFDASMSYSGTYKIEGNKIIHDLQICLFPNWIGKPLVRYYSFDEDILVLDTAPVLVNGKEKILRLRWKRNN